MRQFWFRLKGGVESGNAIAVPTNFVKTRTRIIKSKKMEKTKITVAFIFLRFSLCFVGPIERSKLKQLGVPYNIV